MRKSLLLLAVFASTLTLVNAQSGNKSEKNSDDGSETFVKFSEGNKKDASNTGRALKDHFKKDDDSYAFQAISSETDALGFIHTRHQQKYKGITVENGVYVTHSRGGQIDMMSGDFVSIPANFSTKASISESSALETAKKAVGGTEWMWETEDAASYYGKVKGKFAPAGELVIIKNVVKGVSLAWKFDIYATAPVMKRTLVYVDAQSGDIVFENPIIHHVSVTGTLSTRYSGTVSAKTDQVSATSFRLRDPSRGGGVNTYNLKNGTRYNRAVDFTDANNQWTEYNNAAKDNAALDAHVGAQATYDYFKNVHGRNSFNNTNGAINSYIHYSRNYVNAFWDGVRMTYGDGDGVSFDPLTSTDVCAHEIGHGVCTFSANLAYNKESGALNEALSDIWGACVEYYLESQNGQSHPGTWGVGEDFDLRNVAVKGFRSMSNPNQFSDPDTYGGTYWVSQNCTPSSSNDYCGVHTNSGVLNFCFYLLTAGGTGTNDIGNAYNVTGIGITDAAKITYRAETVYMTSSTNYAGARTAFIQAATDLFGAGSQQVISTTNAFYAVGVGAAYPVVAARIASPTNLENIDLTETSFNATWKLVEGANEYDVEVWNGIEWSNFATTKSNFAEITNLEKGSNLAWRVIAKDSKGNTGESKSKEVSLVSDKFSDGSGILALNVYPNPSSEKVELKYTTQNESELMVQVTDLMGRVFIQKSQNINKGDTNLEFDVKNLTAGKYIVRVVEKTPSAPQKQFNKTLILE